MCPLGSVRLNNSALGFVVFCSNGLYLLQREVFLMRGEDYTFLWVERQIFREQLRVVLL